MKHTNILSLNGKYFKTLLHFFYIFIFHISFVVCNSQATDTVVLSLVTDVPSQYD